MSDLLVSFRRRNLSAKNRLFSADCTHRLEAYATLIFRSVERCFQNTYRKVREPGFLSILCKRPQTTPNFASFGHSEQRAMMVIPVGKA